MTRVGQADAHLYLPCQTRITDHAHYPCCLVQCSVEHAIFAQNPDTTWVQTYTWEAQNNPATAYDSPGRRWFDFPASDNDTSYQKVLMYYNLKCFEDGTAGNLGYACGEWDYLTYTYLFDTRACWTAICSPIRIG